ncbi:hypothetical protein BASA50_002836 [Batrachochytrium salamandrivorans]|uniref:Uncharacterized protein n=1 Tax=Batrachochytrium salamandrivorans TaxID=1357716 RepID=A0ABQ8FK28_9FUNG|nr:hypothetical protein BASA50_002836 [Batrachochytrium salamandrivorans]
METLRTCGDSASLQKYVTRKLLDTSGFFKDPSFDQSRAHGTRYLMLQFRNHDSDYWVAALDPGVENVYTWLRGGVLNGEADLDQRWLDGIVEHESMGMRHDNRAAGSTVS